MRINAHAVIRGSMYFEDDEQIYLAGTIDIRGGNQLICRNGTAEFIGIGNDGRIITDNGSISLLDGARLIFQAGYTLLLAGEEIELPSGVTVILGQG